jgi:transforming growth factor-beta-induced protein
MQRIFLLAAFCFSALVLGAGPPADIVDTAAADGSFKTLVAALEAAGLEVSLKGSGPFTLFAPTDAAFAKLPAGTVEDLLKPENREQLRSILKYHLIPGRYTVKDVMYLYGAITAQGQKVLVRRNQERVTVDNARIVKGDIPASNGLIHVIDTVILPRKPVLSDR